MDIARLDDDLFRAALAVGSRDLFAAFERAPSSGRNAARLQRKLLRYLIRMSTRPTPYGLFAGVALVYWGRATDAALASGPPVTRTRPDMEWLLALVADLEADLEVRRHLRLIANGTLIARAGRLFLAESAVAGAGGAPIGSIRVTGAVERALELASRPVAYEQMRTELLTGAGATPEKADRVIDELLQKSVLTTDLRPPLTCSSPVEHVIERLAEIPAAAGIRDGLRGLVAALANWDETALGQRANVWPRLVDRVSSIHPVPESASPVQLDMALPLDGDRVHDAVAAEAVAAAELLLRLSPFPSGFAHLDHYRQAFAARYGHDRDVPLLELVDARFGLGPPTGHGNGGGVDPQRAARRHQTLRDAALEAYRNQCLVVELDEELLTRLGTSSPSLEDAPLSLDVPVFVAARSAPALDAGDFQLIVGPNLGAAAAGRNLGRFAGLLGADAVAGLARLADAEGEREPDCLFAEVVYVPPRRRAANVAVRPPIRRYEIAVGTSAGVPSERVIPLQELVVGVRDGRFYIRWPRMNADVIAVQGHMLNLIQAPPALRFLVEATADRRVQLSPFDWGPAADFPFLPRVQHGRIVLSLARWRVDPQIETRFVAEGSLTAFEAWRARRFIPRDVYLAAGDNRLLLDLEDAAHVELLRDELRALPDGSMLLLQEALPGRDDAWLHGPAGHHMSELVIPMVKRGSSRQPRPDSTTERLVVRETTASTRVRPPGTDWLYLKLYHPPGFADELIAGPVRSLSQFALAGDLADGWFFIRYADPDPHLRIRFHGDPDTLLGPLMRKACELASELMEAGSCSGFSFDVYEREVERYGGPGGMDLAEAIFAADSSAVAGMLRLIGPQLPTIDRETLAVLSVDDLLASVGLSEDERLDWYREHASLSRADGQAYRERQAVLRRLLGRAGALDAEPGGSALEQTVRRRRYALAGISGQLDALAHGGALGQPRSALCDSYVHLHCNRILDGQPGGEQLILQLLRRAREGLARAPVE